MGRLAYAAAFQQQEDERRRQEAWWASLTDLERSEFLRKEREKQLQEAQERREREERAEAQRRVAEMEHVDRIAERRALYGSDSDIRKQIDVLRSSARYPSRSGPINEFRPVMSVLA